MPTVKVPIFNPVQRNADESEITDKTFQLIDAYVDAEGYTIKRPGLKLLLDVGPGINFPIQGLFWWPQKQCALAICNNKVYQLAYVSGTLSATDITTNGPGTAALPTFAVGVDSNVTAPVLYGVLATGGAMVEGHGTGLTISNFTTIADAQAPTTVTHVGFIDGYLTASFGKTFWAWSDVNAPLSWTAASFASAMRNPDAIVAHIIHGQKVMLFGQVSLEVWENDGASPFAPVPNGAYEKGCIAPYSIVADHDSVYWLDHTKRFVRYKGGAIEEITSPYDTEISKFSATADCIGFKIEIAGQKFLIFQFPTAERTLVYTVAQDSWSEWKHFDSSVGEYRHFLGKSYCYCPDWGIHLVGSRLESKIYSMSPDFKDDDGSPIRVARTTGHLDFGTTKDKRSRELRVRMKRGEGLPSGIEPVLMVRWRDDNKRWSNEKRVSLGKIGETAIVKTIDSRGRYATRQYEFVATDSVSIAFGGVEEDIDILG